MNNKIIAIAITEYDDEKLNNLSNCKNDIENILKILTTKYQFDDIEFIYEKADTTRKNLYNKLKFYFADCLPDENVLLLFSGHGQYDEDLNSTYWQPSDSDHNDSSTWFNLNDLMSFVKVSKSHHISIISDSCFSGAMFQIPSRGGGIEALDKKKSRIGFSSGSIEPVSDGPKGQLSPFAAELIRELKNNIVNDCPLSTIATNVIINFDAGKNQTPTFAPLSNVGHEGGVFILKLKENPHQTTKNIEYLKSKYGNLYIPILDSHFKEFDNVKSIKKKKFDAVKKQDYLEARKIKDEEEKLTSDFPKNFIKKLISDYSDVTVLESNKKKIKEYDEKILQFKKELPDLKKTLKKQLDKFKNENADRVYIRRKLFDIENLDEIVDSIIEEQSYERDYRIYFDKNRENLIKEYNKSLIDLYISFKKIQGKSISDFLKTKEQELIEILENIYKSEVNFLLAEKIDELEFLINFKNNELKILNWIRERSQINYS